MPSLTSRKQLKPATFGFEQVHNFWDRALDRQVAKIMPGQYYVSYGNELIGTVLGSCVSACVRDITQPLGAMNHFMLPTSTECASSVDTPHRYGAFAMEHMLNDLYRRGVKKHNLEVKIVGGGAVIKSASSIGQHNIAFAKSYLANEGISIKAQDVGTSFARHVIYDVSTGKMLVKHLDSSENIRLREQAYLDNVSKDKTKKSDIELF